MDRRADLRDQREQQTNRAVGISARCLTRGHSVRKVKMASAASSRDGASSTGSSDDGWFARSLSLGGSSTGVRGDPSLRLSGSAESGRGVRLGNGCEAGAEILAESAIAPVRSLHAAEVERRCAHCWAMLGAAGAAAASASTSDSSASSSTAVAVASSAAPAAAQRCSGCGVARYCGRACQAGHWRSHRLECVCWRHYKSRLSSSGGRATHPAYMSTVSTVCRIVLWRLQRPLAALAESLVDPAVRDSPTHLALQAKRHSSPDAQQAREAQAQFEEWYQRFERNVTNIDKHTEERRKSYFEMATLGRFTTSHKQEQTAA